MCVYVWCTWELWKMIKKKKKQKKKWSHKASQAVFPTLWSYIISLRLADVIWFGIYYIVCCFSVLIVSSKYSLHITCYTFFVLCMITHTQKPASVWIIYQKDSNITPFSLSLLLLNFKSVFSLSLSFHFPSCVQNFVTRIYEK